MAIADFNGDGRLDLVTLTTKVAGDGYRVFLSGAGGILLAGPATAVDGSRLEGVVAGDFTGGGKADIAFATGTFNAVYVARRRGGRLHQLQLREHRRIDAIDVADINADGLAVSDFNGDGRFDFAAADPANDVVSFVINRRTNEVPGVAVVAGTITLSGADATVSKSDGVIAVSNVAGTRRLAAVAMRSVVANNNTTISSDLGQRDGPRKVSLTAASSVTLTSSQHLRTVTVSGRLTVAAGVSKFLRVADLVTTPSSVIDLTTNDMILDFPFGGASPQIVIRGVLATGRSTLFAGLTSSTAYSLGSPGNTALRYMTAAEHQSVYDLVAPFAGENIDTAAVLIR